MVLYSNPSPIHKEITRKWEKIMKTSTKEIEMIWFEVLSPGKS